VVPGDRLEILVTKQRSRGNVWKFSGDARVDEKAVADAIFTAMIRDK
jgi:3-hydroxyacyl-[acyl-carrier-protein] dehydratase